MSCGKSKHNLRNHALFSVKKRQIIITYHKDLTPKT